MANRYWVGGTANWDGTAGSKWSTTSGGAGGEAVPTAADSVFLDAASGTVTVTITTVNAVCRSFNATGFTGTLTTSSASLIVGDGTAGTFTLGSGMTFGAGFSLSFISTVTGNTITSNGKSISGDTTFNGVGGVWTLQDALSITGNLSLSSGTFNANNFNVTAREFNSTGTATRVLTMGSGTFTFSHTANVWNAESTGLTINANTSTINITDSGAGTKTFTGGGFTYNNVSITAGGSGSVDFSGSNTFNVFTINAPKTVRFTAATTNTFTSFVAKGSSGNVITISSITAATHTLSKSTGAVSSDYLSLTNSIATGGASWFAGRSSTNVSGNTGWLFEQGFPERSTMFQLFNI